MKDLQNAEAALLHGADIKDIMEGPMKVDCRHAKSLFVFATQCTLNIESHQNIHHDTSILCHMTDKSYNIPQKITKST